jgi:hypothetical protein
MALDPDAAHRVQVGLAIPITEIESEAAAKRFLTDPSASYYREAIAIKYVFLMLAQGGSPEDIMKLETEYPYQVQAARELFRLCGMEQVGNKADYSA